MKFSRLIKFGLKHLAGYKVQGIGLNLTRRCNLDCDYCKIKDNSKLIQQKELSHNQWKLIIDKFIKNNHVHFIFTGGEPLLYEGVYELIDYSYNSALTSLITNASFLDEHNLRKLKNLDFLTFSFDTSKKNSSLCKNPTNKLKIIRKYSKKYDIATSAILTITSKNTSEIEDIIKLLNNYKISILLSLLHSDRGNYDFRNYTPHLEFKRQEDYDNLINLQNRLLQLKKEGYKIAESDDFIKNMINYVTGNYKIQCLATNPFFTIDFDGRIKACHDTKPSDINALQFEDYNKMKNKVKKTVKAGCNCYYDCYINNEHKISNFLQVFRR